MPGERHVHISLEDLTGNSERGDVGAALAAGCCGAHSLAAGPGRWLAGRQALQHQGARAGESRRGGEIAREGTKISEFLGCYITCGLFSWLYQHVQTIYIYTYIILTRCCCCGFCVAGSFGRDGNHFFGVLLRQSEAPRSSFSEVVPIYRGNRSIFASPCIDQVISARFYIIILRLVALVYRWSFRCLVKPTLLQIHCQFLVETLIHSVSLSKLASHFAIFCLEHRALETFLEPMSTLGDARPGRHQGLVAQRPGPPAGLLADGCLSSEKRS